MAVKKGGLGRGLDSLFIENSTSDDGDVTTITVSKIERDSSQPRKIFDDDSLSQLADSIKEHGIVQPILVRPTLDDSYIIVAGERRYRAARLLGLTEVPVIIKEMSDEQAAEIALVENLQRENLNPIEEAQGYRSLMDSYGLTQDDVAKKVGKSRPRVANSLRLLNLPSNILELVQSGELSSAHGRTLLGLEAKDKINIAATEIIDKNMSVRGAENLVKKLNTPIGGRKVEKSIPNSYKEVEIALRDAIGRRVKVTRGKKGGFLQIEFLTEAELTELANLISKRK